jgi:hypothetical protein
MFLYYFFTFFLSFPPLANSLRFADSWQKLFRSSLGRETTEIHELSYKRRQNEYLSSFSSTDNRDRYPFVLQYRRNCGTHCHDMIREATCSIDDCYYSVVNSDHAVIRLKFASIHRLVETFPSLIIDYSPFIPELKIEEDITLNLNQYCDTKSTASTIDLHVTFFPMDEEEIYRVTSHLNSVSHHSSTSTLFTSSSNPSSPPSPFLLLPQSHTTSSYVVVPDITCASTLSIASSLSNLPQVQWVEIRPTFYPSLKWANSVMQGDSGRSGNKESFLEKVNITGIGNIIGIADTGIDEMSCYFYDPLVPFPYSNVNYAHRKVILYVPYVDRTDGYGHGSAVAGAAAGNCKKSQYGDLSQFNAAAMDSKIAFFDIGDSNGALSLPFDINVELFGVLRKAGARVLSMSWGSNSNRYTVDARCVVCGVWCV